MSNKKVWLVTGASRGTGVEFAKAALAVGHAVVASGRDPDRVSKALGHSNDLLPVKLDVTSRADAGAAVEAADLKAQIEAHRELSTSLAFD